MTISPWNDQSRHYTLSNGFSLERAEPGEYSKHFAVYRIYRHNAWFRQSWEHALAATEGVPNSFWLQHNGRRVGGLLIEPNGMGPLFVASPDVELSGVVEVLKDALVAWSDPNRSIHVFGVLPQDLEHFLRMGFHVEEKRRCMIRPTEDMAVDWDEGYSVVPANERHGSKLAQLFSESFGNDDHRRTFEAHQDSVRYYLAHNDDALLSAASTLVYDDSGRHLVGACLVSMWEDWPLVYDVGVIPAHRRRGLASKMIRRALSVLNGEYPALRLFVTSGNPAEQVYKRLGFLGGSEQATMVLPLANRK